MLKSYLADMHSMFPNTEYKGKNDNNFSFVCKIAEIGSLR